MMEALHRTGQWGMVFVLEVNTAPEMVSQEIVLWRNGLQEVVRCLRHLMWAEVMHHLGQHVHVDALKKNAIAIM